MGKILSKSKDTVDSSQASKDKAKLGFEEHPVLKTLNA